MADVYVLLGDKNKSLPPLTYYEHNKELFTRKNQEGYGVFKAVNAFEATEEDMQEAGVATKRNIQFLHEIRYAFGDLDIAKAGDGTPPEEKQRRKEVLKEALLTKLRPTLIIDTANGLQPLWKFSECAIDKETQAKYVASINSLIEWSKQYGAMGDAVKDVTRVLRVPGYYHMKEEPYLCSFCYKSDKVYIPEEFYAAFPPTEKRNVVPHQVSVSDNPVLRELDRIPFQDLIVKAFNYMGRTAEFDRTGKLILDGRMTGTFQGRKGDRDYLASSSHEPFKGNRVTAVGDILGKTNKDAYKWICEHFGLDEKKIEKHERVVKAVESLQIVSHEATLNATHMYYSFGTEKLTDLLCPIERHDFIVLAGQVNSGKTTYTYWLAQDNALLGHKVYYFSLEMDPETIIKNMALSRAGITKREYTRRMVEPIPQVKQNDFYKYTKELREFPNLTIMGFRGGANVTWEVVKTKLDTITDADLFILDNLDMIKSDNEKDTDMARQERITQEIQGYTHNRQIPIILVHHYRKTNMDTTQEGPRSLDSLRGSGRIAANADMVLNVGRLMSPDISEDEKRKFLVHQIKARLFSTGSGEIYYYGGKFHDQDLPSMVQDVFSNNYYEPQSEL